jgi:glycosyltransferase involved in cell wall biosynthesis
MGTDFVVLGTYPPTQCGLATFSAALLGDLPGPGDRVGVVRVLDEPSPDMAPPVVHDLVNGTAVAADDAAAVMNRFGVAIIQHEYGIYGGPDGADLLSLMQALTVPSIVVLHTVLAEPGPWQKMILGEVIAAASAVVTMTETGRQRVLDQYGTDPAKVTVIPHGAATYWASARPADTAAVYWQRLGLPGNLPARLPIRRPGGLPRILTWGLIGPGKGIEHAIDAIALLRDEGIRVRYTIAGETHPKVRARSGEAYRRSLQDRAVRLGVLDLVRFDDRYLAPRALARLVRSAGTVLLPYDSAEQVTSGVLIEAVAAGKPVVATGFPHAVELLSGGAGLLVGRHDPAAIAAALRRVLTEPGQAALMARHAAALAPGLLWPAVAAAYRELAASLAGDLTAGLTSDLAGDLFGELAAMSAGIQQAEAVTR